MQDPTSISLLPLTVRGEVNGGVALARPATLPPFLPPGLRPVVLRPALSGSLPFTSFVYPRITQNNADYLI